MNKDEQLQFMLEHGIVAIVRIKEPSELVRVAQAIQAGGVRVIEFTMTTPNALDAIRELAAQWGERILLGAGTVLDPETGRAAFLAGAQFLVAPNFNPELIHMARRYGKIVVPGAFTPTEILAAWECGADIVKVFPATAVGPQYIKDVLAPLPQIRLLPTGGVSLENIEQFILAGACAVAVGGNLVDSKMVREKNWDALTENARRYAQAVSRARGPKSVRS
ncbi:MAG: bifunctional 4-hydroxy-2-oxoglutarate aldolase/2-dehydro-3-deoxy-phosphogluconate aldolase [Chloroflexi bacterium]|nr:bifunctional 4-hydroxy-2-oxoglutarate aldolase/2-dehydro-3-deoxy-phosphogluconate aldolase [Chloroflexota bacterium]